MSAGSGAGMTGEILHGDGSEETRLLIDRKAVLDKELEEGSVFVPVIHRAHASLRDLKREHFDSTVVSLGLLGRCSWNSFGDVTRELDSFKIDVLIAFLADIRKGPEEWIQISREVVDRPEDMKKLYDQNLCSGLQSETVQSALALDAIFVTCFLWSLARIFDSSWRSVQIFKPVFRNAPNTSALLADIFKLENQIPLVLLRNVVSIAIQATRRNGPVGDYRTLEGEHENLRDANFQRICSAFRRNCMRFFPSSPFSDPDLQGSGYHHLLHSAAEALQCAAKAYPLNESQSHGRFPRKRRLLTKHDNKSVSFDLGFRHLPTATELNKRGVSFKGHNAFALKFEQNRFARWAGTLFLPRLNFIGEDTEQAWRNLIAWEQAHPGNYKISSRKPFTKYLVVMKKLIHNERDVSFLLKGENPVFLGVGLGGNQKVVDLFHATMMNTFYSPKDEWFSTLHEVNDFYDRSLGKLVGEFVQTYCSRPWLVISILAAFILLTATVFQTVYTVKSYYESTAGPGP